MDNRLRCEIVRDLLPTYVEGLTSDVTNEEMELHLSSCEECKKLYNEMKTPIESSFEVKEMDYLKTVKKQTNKKLLLGIVGIAFVFILLIGIRIYAVGNTTDSVADYNVIMSSTMEGDDVLVIQGELASHTSTFKKHVVTVKDNIATIKLIERHAMPGEKDNNYYVGYQIPSGVNQVVFADKILWEDGILITKEANEIYNTKHAYIGDMSANGRTAGALQIGKFGNYLNSLETSEQPYGWTMEFTDTIENDTIFNERMTQYAYVILALIDNLDRVSWEYNNGSEMIKETVTVEDATKALGKNIKEYAKSLSEFQRLLMKLYL
ncbi:DUF4825 domain-containing protein [Anaerosporobacter sp.]|uniref:DUF4825 domain-containing protein n=1 Tax=Anaerosporobacter sp. TaxID=1872529 RepID=UPI00286F66A7|nr:DUF4825 domain-containing protein [Anaerosporobacter sp.]